MRVLAWCLILLGGGAASQPPPAAAPSHRVSEQDAQSSLDLMQQGAELLDLGHYDEAIAALTRAIALDRRNGLAFANRALGYGHTNRLDEARQDVAAADAIIPGQAIVHRGRALIALRESDDATALAELTKAIEKEPGDPFSLWFRAWLYQDSKNEAAALADADAYVAARPNDADGYVLKADLLRAQQKTALSMMEADQLVQRFPEDAHALAAAARIYGVLGEKRRALDAIGKAITFEPDEFRYRLLRAGFRDKDDRQGRRSDLDSALALDPGNASAMTKIGLIDFEEHKWDDAIARFSAVLAKEPKDFGLLAYRSMANSEAGHPDAANADYQSALSAASGPDDFDLICHSFGIEGKALDRGLDSCDRAIAVAPNDSGYRSNRGLVNLRRGKLTEALADYDLAVGADDRRANGFMGRALVRWRMGDEPGADADRKRAMALDPLVLDRFREFGFNDF